MNNSAVLANSRLVLPRWLLAIWKVTEHFEHEGQVCIKPYNCCFSRVFLPSVCIATYGMSVPSQHTKSTDSMIVHVPRVLTVQQLWFLPHMYMYRSQFWLLTCQVTRHCTANNKTMCTGTKYLSQYSTSTYTQAGQCLNLLSNLVVATVNKSTVFRKSNAHST